MPTSYNIIISEVQRELIEAALNLLTSAKYPQELIDLKQMVAELPKEETLTPGVTHGLCL